MIAGLKTMGEFLFDLGQAILEDEAGVHVSNPDRMREFMMCADIVKRMFKGTGAKVTVTPRDVFPNVGCIEVVAKGLSITNTEMFAKVAELSSNYEIYPKLDGTIVFDFSFYGLTEKAEG